MYKDNLEINVEKRKNGKGPYVIAIYEYGIDKKAILELDASAGKNKNIKIVLEIKGDEPIDEGFQLCLKRSIKTIYKIEGSIITKSLQKIASEIRRNVDYCFSNYLKSDELSFLYGQLFDIVKTVYKNY